MYKALKQNFENTFGHGPKYIFSAPGRTEIGGNHTDHQHGRVLAAAINMEMAAAVAENSTGVIQIQSEGYPLARISLDDLSIHAEEQNTTPALIRGVAAGFLRKDFEVHGFDAYITSTVLPGSGLSSSAAFEVLIGTILNHLFNDRKATPVEVAQIGQYAEGIYFGKPCGLMDQTASAVGGVIGIDFADPTHPVVDRMELDLGEKGYALCILDSGASHADLTDEYAAVPREMKAVAALFGKEVLRDVPESVFFAKMKEVRAQCGDRAALRAMHFFGENIRVEKEISALKAGDFEDFLRLVNQSGRSSQVLLQNITPTGYSEHQEMGFALAQAERLLDGRGAVRVHGGGFAGTIQAFVPLEMLEKFRCQMEDVLGSGTCHILSVRKTGGVLLETL